MNYNIKNKIAIITGGSHGIGRAIAIQLALEGCHIAICARNKQRLKDVKFEIEQKNVKCVAIECDVFDKERCHYFVNEVIREFHTVHILVNNVGGGGRWGDNNPEKTPENVWHEVYDKNVGAAIRFTMLCLPYMREQNWGRVIAITSRYSVDIGGRPWFNMSKAAEHVLMKNLSLQKEIVRHGITFNSVAPGDIIISGTGWSEPKNIEIQSLVDKEYPIGHLGTPEDVAFAVAFLCAEQALFINGANIAVDGGVTRGL